MQMTGPFLITVLYLRFFQKYSCIILRKSSYVQFSVFNTHIQWHRCGGQRGVSAVFPWCMDVWGVELRWSKLVLSAFISAKLLSTSATSVSLRSSVSAPSVSPFFPFPEDYSGWSCRSSTRWSFMSALRVLSSKRFSFCSLSVLAVEYRLLFPCRSNGL